MNLILTIFMEFEECEAFRDKWHFLEEVAVPKRFTLLYNTFRIQSVKAILSNLLKVIVRQKIMMESVW